MARPGYGRARRRDRGHGAQQRKSNDWWNRQNQHSSGKGKTGSKGKNSYTGGGGGKGWQGRGQNRGEQASSSSGSTQRLSEDTSALAWQAFHKLLDRQ